MTSQVQYTQINEHYPVAGQDNNSQGFRNNFGYIKTGLAVAGSEISALQNRVQTVEDTVGFPAQLNANNNGNKLLNVVVAETGLVTQLVLENTEIDCSIANYIQYQTAQDSTVSFINWNAAPICTKIRIEFENINTYNATAWEPNTEYFKDQLIFYGNYYWVKNDHISGGMFNESYYELTHEKPNIHGTLNRESLISFSGNVKSSMNLPLVLPGNPYIRTIVDVWSMDEGSTIFINLVGYFS